MDPITPFNFEPNIPPTQVGDIKRDNIHLQHGRRRMSHLPVYVLAPWMSWEVQNTELNLYFSLLVK